MASYRVSRIYELTIQAKIAFHPNFFHRSAIHF